MHCGIGFAAIGATSARRKILPRRPLPHTSGQVEEVADLKYRLSSLTQWRDIQADPKWGFATDDAIDEIFRNLPRLVRDKRDGSIELIDYDNAAEWRGDLERKPSLYQWLPINGNTL